MEKLGEEVLDWIKYPDVNNKSGISAKDDTVGGLRNQNIVMYNDGMTEKQFVHMMEKQYDAKEEQHISKKRKTAKMKESSQDLAFA